PSRASPWTASEVAITNGSAWATGGPASSSLGCAIVAGAPHAATKAPTARAPRMRRWYTMTDDAHADLDRGQLAAPRRRCDVRERTEGDVGAVDPARRRQPDPAGDPGAVGARAGPRDLVRDRDRRVLRAGAARALRRGRRPPRAARLARCGRR